VNWKGLFKRTGTIPRKTTFDMITRERRKGAEVKTGRKGMFGRGSMTNQWSAAGASRGRGKGSWLSGEAFRCKKELAGKSTRRGGNKPMRRSEPEGRKEKIHQNENILSHAVYSLCQLSRGHSFSQEEKS